MAPSSILQENVVDGSPPVKGLEVDVVVVGGGFSGVQAAWDLQKAGLSCVLLEARHRIGGRSYSHQLANGKGVVELGATWINDKTQPKVYGTAKRLGLDLVKQYIGGDDILEAPDGSIMRTAPGSPEAEMMQQLVLAAAGFIEHDSGKIDIHEPESFPAKKDMTVEKWVDALGFDNPLAVAFMQLFTSAVLGRDIPEVGMHYFLDYVKSGCGFMSLFADDENGAQYLKTKQGKDKFERWATPARRMLIRFTTGTSAIATGLVAELLPGSVFVNCPVNAIHQSTTGVEVQTATGSTIVCRKVIIAIPTNVYKLVNFSPSLPERKQNLVSQTMPGHYGKMVLTYTSAWWRDLGLSGKFNSVTGPISISWDISADDGSHHSLGMFMTGGVAADWAQLDDLKRKEAVIEHLARMVGSEHAEKARDVLEINYVSWGEQDFIWGAPTNSMGPGLLSTYGSALREPFGNVHFAGGETAYEWKGYLEGALRAGSRAADEVIAKIQKG